MTTFVGELDECRRILATCSESVARQAQWLLRFLARLDREKGLITGGSRIQAGWALLTINEEGTDLVVHAPDFDRDPFQTTTTDLTVFLSVQAQQNDFLRRLGLHGESVSFQEKVVTAQGALQQDRVYLERTAERSADDSGWYVGPVEGPTDEPQLEALFVYQLLHVRPSLLQALALPAGYLVVFRGQEVEAVLNEENKDLLLDALPHAVEPLGGTEN